MNKREGGRKNEREKGKGKEAQKGEEEKEEEKLGLHKILFEIVFANSASNSEILY